MSPATAEVVSIPFSQAPTASNNQVVAAWKRRVCLLPARNINGVDVFFAANLLLFLGMCVFAYYARWIKYAGHRQTAVTEFLFYAVVLFLAVGALWRWLRRYPFPSRLLVLIEFGILLHFAGGLVHFGGARLYDHIYFGVRYDKYVHFANALFATIVVQQLFHIKHVPVDAFTRFVIFFVVLGLGCVIEICEFVVTLTIPQNGVGGYDDNMRDLIANACGGAVFLLCRGRWPGRRRVHPPPSRADRL
jgi:uncharacterized membrane protein YjdF